MFEPECKLLYSEMSNEELKIELEELILFTQAPMYVKDTEIEYHISFLVDRLDMNKSKIINN